MSHTNPRRKTRARQPYRGSRRFDATCRNHGSCGWCRGNRTAQAKREHERLDMLFKEDRWGRGGDPKCKHDLVRRRSDGRYACTSCGEGFMSLNDAQVMLLKVELGRSK